MRPPLPTGLPHGARTGGPAAGLVQRFREARAAHMLMFHGGRVDPRELAFEAYSRRHCSERIYEGLIVSSILDGSPACSCARYSLLAPQAPAYRVGQGHYCYDHD
jgi:hypothetical protein